MEDFKQVLAKDWYGVTTVNDTGLAVVVLMGLLMLIIPRRYAILPVVVVACFVSCAQRIVISGFDFDFLRIMVCFGWARLLLRRELRAFTWRGIDTLMAGHTIVGSIAYVILHGQESGALSNRLGYLFTALGMYFLFRMLIRTRQDLDAVIASFVLASVPVAVFFAIEYTTGRNMFSVFGGVPEITQIRSGRLRCQGAFAHPIIAGAFWASILPLFAAKIYSSGRWLVLGPVGVAMVLFIVFTTSSSTPVMAVIFGAIGAVFYFVRNWMRYIQWGIFAMLVALHLAMNKPVWHLLARLTVFDSSTGWHRYWVIQLAVDHFEDWWLLGTISTLEWQGLYDITNEFVYIGVQGGVLPVILFALMIVLSFSTVGYCRQECADRHDRAGEILAWSLGVSLFVHLMTFIAISYFGQMRLVWFLLVALIASGAVLNDGRTARRAAVEADPVNIR